MTPESKPQGSLLPIGTRIRFTKTLASLASGDHPAFLFAEEGDEGEITGHGTKEGYWAKTSYNPPFGVSRDEFEPIEASKPQGSEQPKCWACNNERLTIISENPTWYRCPHCREEFQWPTPDAPLGPLTGSPLPTPSADEEVETPRTNEELVDAKHCDECGYEVVLADAMRKLERELTQLRQQHNAEREEFIESAVARDKKADEDRDAYESLINELKAQLEAARTQCALRSAGHDDLRTRLNKANAQKTALYFENSDALAELQQLRASLAERDRLANSEIKALEIKYAETSRRADELDDLQAKFYAKIIELKSELATAQAEKHGLEDVVLATRNMSIEAFDRIRALIGASPNDPRPCETLVSELIESLRSQLQTAMEERDQWGKELGEAKGAIDTLERLLKGAEEERDAAIRECVARGIETEEANSRLEEAEKVLSAKILGHDPEPYLYIQFPATVGHMPLMDWFASLRTLLSRLSTSRETEDKP